jgi:hypothetical protein
MAKCCLSIVEVVKMNLVELEKIHLQLECEIFRPTFCRAMPAASQGMALPPVCFARVCTRSTNPPAILKPSQSASFAD